MDGGPGRGRARRLEPEPGERRVRGGARRRTRRRRRQGIRVDRGDGRGRFHRRDLDLRPQRPPDRQHGGDRRGHRRRPRPPGRRRLREAARPQRGGSAADGRAGARDRRPRRLPGEPGVQPLGRSRPRTGLGARRPSRRAALPDARRRGTLRPAQRLVLAGRAPGRRRAERHDVPLGRGGALPAHRTGQAAQQPDAEARPRADPLPEVAAPRVRPQAARPVRRRRRLRAAAGRGLRPRDGRVRRRRRHASRGRSDDLVELRGRRPAPVDGAPGTRVLDAGEQPRHGARALLQPRPGAAKRRGPGREAERGDGPHAGARERAGSLRLRRREPAHGGELPARRTAAGDLRGRS